MEVSRYSINLEISPHSAAPPFLKTLLYLLFLLLLWLRFLKVKWWGELVLSYGLPDIYLMLMKFIFYIQTQSSARIVREGDIDHNFEGGIEMGLVDDEITGVWRNTVLGDSTDDCGDEDEK